MKRKSVTRKRRKPSNPLVKSVKRASILKLLDALSNGYSNAGACTLAGISSAWFYTRLRTDEIFRAAALAAQEDGSDHLEDIARHRAIEGIDKPLVHKGRISMTEDANGKRVPVTVKQYSDTLLMFLLNGRRPEKYVTYHKHGGDARNPIQVRTVLELVNTASKLPLIIDQDGRLVEVKRGEAA